MVLWIRLTYARRSQRETANQAVLQIVGYLYSGRYKIGRIPTGSDSYKDQSDVVGTNGKGTVEAEVYVNQM